MRARNYLLILLFGVMATVIPCCGRSDEYSQSTPEDVLASVIAMVKNGEPGKLPRLIYADSREYRTVLNRLGTLLDSLQGLAVAMRERFPDDVKRLRDELVKADGQGLLGSLAGGGLSGLQRQPATDAQRSERRAERERLGDQAIQLLADPFAIIDANAARLGVVRVTDESATITLDGSPLLGGILQLQRRDGQWFIVLPLNLPGVSAFVPQTRAEWSIIGSLVRVMDNMAKELTEDVRDGKIKRIEQLAEKAGEKVFLPAGMVFIVYGKEMDVRRQRDRALRAFRTRAGEWVDTRVKAGEDEEPLKDLVEVVGRVAVERLDTAVRARLADPALKLPVFDKITDEALLEAMTAWLASVGDTGSLSGSISADRVAQAKAAVERNLRSTLKPGR